MIFQPTTISLLSALVAGTFIGLLRLVSRGSETLEVVLPVIAAFLVTRRLSARLLAAGARGSRPRLAPAHCTNTASCSEVDSRR